MLKILLFCGAVALSSAASAQDAVDNFVGPFVGVEAGLVQHHFSLIVSEQGRPDQTISVKGYGLGGAAVAGYDFKLGSNFTVGAEAGVHFGGKSASTIIPPLVPRIGIDPKLGYSLTGRIGYATSDKVLLFGRAGYGSHKYGDLDLTNIDAFGTNKSFILGAGAEYRVNRKVAARFDARHLDGSRNEILVGVLTRF